MIEDRYLNASHVLVVGSSSVNCVVVSRVVERMGLKVRVERPENAALALRDTTPAIVILDGGPQAVVARVVEGLEVNIRRGGQG